jgi:hypothetical protein
MRNYKLAILGLIIGSFLTISNANSAHADGVLDFFKKKDAQQSSQQNQSQDSQPLFLKPKKGMTPQSQYKAAPFSQYKNSANSMENISGTEMLQVSKDMELEYMDKHSEKVKEYETELNEKLNEHNDKLKADWEKKVELAKAEQAERRRSGMESGEFDDIVAKYQHEMIKLEGKKSENAQKATKSKIKTQQDREVHDPIRLFKDFR